MADLIKHGDTLKCWLGRLSDRDNMPDQHKDLEVRITKIYNEDKTYDKVEVGLDDFTFRYPDDVHDRDPANGTITFALGDFYVMAEVNDKLFIPEQKEAEEKIKNEVIGELGLDKVGNIEYKGIENDFFLKDLIAILKRMDVKTIVFNDGNSIDIK